jgi:hypothetical protein
MFQIYVTRIFSLILKIILLVIIKGINSNYVENVFSVI